MTVSAAKRPKHFTLFINLCLAYGALHFLIDAFILAMGISHGVTPGATGAGSFVSLSVFHLLRDAGLVLGGIQVGGRVRWAANLIVVCAAASLAELVSNTALAAAKGTLVLEPSTVLFFLVPLAVEGGLLYYFRQPELRLYLDRR